MKTIIALLMSTLLVVPAAAVTLQDNFGINFSVDNAIGFQGEFDISSLSIVNNEPVSAQVFLKNYSQNIAYPTSWGGINYHSWSTTGIGIAGIYDFSAMAELGKNYLPYAGIGLMYIHHRWTGVGPALPYTGVTSGLYFTGGIQYTLTPRVAADFNYNNFGSFTAGLIIRY
jgi:opacity protein-like surface antigen